MKLELKMIEKFSQLSDKKRKWYSISLSVFIAIILTLLGIYVIEEYGVAMFIITPFFLGFTPIILYNYKNKFEKNISTELGYFSLTFFMLGLIIFAIEGLVCIAMALPIAIFITYLGTISANFIIKKRSQQGPTLMILLIFVIPGFSFIEHKTEPTIHKVITTIDINASADQVWNNVIEFPTLKKPTEFIFKAGIAYPINATIKGKGVGAIRYCNFTTGSFVEPITKWEKNKLLAFDVLQQPAPMKELSFWDIDAPHLHDYFVSQKGQFKLIKLSKKKTRLIGTTWYKNDIKPAFYWNLWSSNFIHQIHNRVLNHIKINAEK